MLCLVLFCLFLISGTLSDGTASRVVDIAQGPVRGYKDPNEDIFVFYSIPYATAPTGLNKFKAPLPPPKWSEPFDAVDKGIVCPQTEAFSMFRINKTMQEDCLIANIYIPNTNKKYLPVVVFVHGGGFIMGYGDLTTPKKLVNSKNIVAVTFNYRLGAHGFLCLGTEDVPGNGGMKDQVALLRWVKGNIESFGGNPNDVTIAGCSAGGASVGLLMLSKMARGLFNKVIPESGDVVTPYSIQSDPINNARKYARSLNFDNVEDIFALENFYKNAPYELLQSVNTLHRTDFANLITSCVERDLGQEIFLDDDPLSILKSGNFDKLPILYGFADMEGLIRVEVFDQWKDKMNTDFEEFLPIDLQFANDDVRNDVVKNIKKFYFQDKPVDNSSILDYINYFTDILFSCPTLRTTRLLLEAGNYHIYLYEYSFVDASTPVVPHTNVKGANHCAQTLAVLDGANLTVKDETIISNDFKNWKQLIREVWLNFIIKGKPESSAIPEWPPVKDYGSPYMVLKQNPELKEFLLKDRCSFWDEIYETYYKKPITPSPLSLPKRTEL